MMTLAIRMFERPGLSARLLCLALMAASCAGVESETEGPTTLRDPERSHTLTEFEFARDSSTVPLEAVLPSLRFEPTHGRLPNFGYTRDRLFARFTIENRTSQKEWVLRLNNPHLRNVRLYLRTGEGYHELFHSDYQLPASSRPLFHRDFCFPIAFMSGDRLELMVVTETGQWLGFVPSVATTEVTLRNRNREIGVGLFGLGGVIFVLLYNLFLWVVTRDRTYVLYVLASVTTHLLAVPGATGALTYLFPHSPLFEETLWHAAAVGWLGFTSFFTRQLLVRDPRHVVERNILTISGLISFTLVWVPILTGPHDTVATIFNVLTGLGQVVIFAIAIKAAVVWKDRVAGVFIAAWGAPLVAGGVFIVTSHGAGPVTDDILYVLTGSSVWEVVVMALALGFRINLLRKQKAVGVAKLREANTELTRQISERSVQLFSALRLVDEPLLWKEALAPGTEINGRYRIESALAKGAMGAVYVARRLHDDTLWALKVAVETRRETLARFAREAHIASLIRHENVVHIADLDISATGFMYIVLELVNGQNARDWVKSQGPASAREAAAILLQVAQGLRALHAKGIAHRDLKPANVLLTKRPDGSQLVKIADFGVSNVGSEALWAEGSGGAETQEALDATREVEMPVDAAADATAHAPAASAAEASSANLDLTKVGRVSGTPRFIAPELVQLYSKDYLRADLYAFGVTAYQLVTGEYPFEALPYDLQRVDMINTLRPAPLPASHAALEPLILRCLSFEHLKRPSAEDLVSVLEAIVSNSARYP